MENIFWLQPVVLWFLLGLVLLCLEWGFPAVLFLFFGLAAWVNALLCFMFPLSFTVQLLIFLVVSIAFLVTLRRWLRGFLASRHSWYRDPTRQDDLRELVGQSAVVVAAIQPPHSGRVLLHGSEWTAIARSPIEINTPVTIVSNDSLILKVQASDQN